MTEGYVTQSFIKGNGPYETVITYQYNVDNHQYQSTHLLDHPGSHYELFRSRAMNIISNYSPNRRVFLFYDPKNPQTATLNIYFGKSSLEATVRGLIFIFICLLFFFASGAPWNTSGRLPPVGNLPGSSLISKSLAPKRRS